MELGRSWYVIVDEDAFGLLEERKYIASVDIWDYLGRRGTAFPVSYLSTDKKYVRFRSTYAVNFRTLWSGRNNYYGDQVLCMVAEHITRCIGQNDTASRLGGDKFNILLLGVPGPDAATKVAEKILKAIATPFYLNGSKYFINASIGISMFPNDGEDKETLVRNADTAMYLAKKQRAHFQFFTAATNTEYLERLRLHNDLRQAIGTEELFLNFQPKVDATDGRICGVEALARWRHPKLGMVFYGILVITNN